MVKYGIILVIVVLIISIISSVFLLGQHYESLKEDKNASQQIVIQGENTKKVDGFNDDTNCTHVLGGKLQPNGECQ